MSDFFCLFFGVWGIPRGTLSLLLALCSLITHGEAEKVIWRARDQAKEQGKCLQLYYLSRQSLKYYVKNFTTKLSHV